MENKYVMLVNIFMDGIKSFLRFIIKQKFSKSCFYAAKLKRVIVI